MDPTRSTRGVAPCCTDTAGFAPYTMHLTDRFGTHSSIAPMCINWSWCTSVNVASAIAWNGTACAAGAPGGAVIAVWYNVTCVGGSLRITRQWASRSGTPMGYVGSSDVTCSATGLGSLHCGNALDCATATIPGRPCAGISWSGTLTPGAFNVMPDPVGGTVTICP